MTQEEKQLLLKDLCARLPYGVKVDVSKVEEWKELTLTPFILSNYYDDIEKIKPYLRPMSSMTEEEKEELCNLCTPVKVLDEDTQEYLYTSYYVYFGHKEEDVEDDEITIKSAPLNYFPIDWLNAHHFDYRGLIPMGLALEAPEDLYKTE